MMSANTIPNTNIVELNLEGKATEQEYDAVLAELEAAIAKHGKIRGLFQFGEMNLPPIPWSRFEADTKFGLHHFPDISHIAMVADQSWLHTFCDAMNPLLKVEIKCFKVSDVEQAKEWLKTSK